MIELKSTQANITLKSPTVVSGSVDLSNYYTKAETEALIPDVSGFITEIPSEYVTETELEAKGYLTEHQSLADYSTTTQVQSMINTAIAGITDAEAVNY